MTTEWKDLPTLQDVACAQADGWEIEVQVDAGNDKYCPWKPWKQETWSFTYLFRARPRQPKTKKVKYECYDINGILSWLQQGRSTMIEWIRQPHLDLEGEVPDGH